MHLVEDVVDEGVEDEDVEAAAAVVVAEVDVVEGRDWGGCRR